MLSGEKAEPMRKGHGASKKNHAASVSVPNRSRYLIDVLRHKGKVMLARLV
jgi:hypothetical protein